MVTQKNLNKISKEFQREEGRGPIMDMAQTLLKEGKRDEAVLLILATWNFASFRYVITKFDINKFKKVLSETQNKLKKINKKFERIDFERDEYKQEIIELFDYLSNENITIKKDSDKSNSIGPTGASKILYMLKPDVFIMWDSFIRREYPIINYKSVLKHYTEILNKKQYPLYKKNGAAYYKFLKDMCLLFIKDKKLNLPPNKSGIKTWPKVIDEFNFVNLSMKVGKKLKEKKLKEKN